MMLLMQARQRTGTGRPNEPGAGGGRRVSGEDNMPGTSMKQANCLAEQKEWETHLPISDTETRVVLLQSCGSATTCACMTMRPLLRRTEEGHPCSRFVTVSLIHCP